MRILIVEDEVSLQKSLVKGFRKFGYAVDFASDGEQALILYGINFYDALILDLNLPRIDGIDVLKTIRKENKEIKIIILSARSEVENRIEGLDSGANDFLIKPFHFAELEARLRALLRRKFVQQDTIISFGGFVLNTSQKLAAFESDKVNLTKKEYGILEYLLLHKGKVISSEELIEHVWEDDADLFINTFKVHITSLKKKLNEKTNAEIIKNIRGVGYLISEEK